MKTRVFWAALSSLFLAAGLVAGPRDAAWKDVETSIQSSLPKTAIQRLEPIIREALADKAYPEAVKAIVRKATLEAGIEGDVAVGRILRLQVEADKLPRSIRPAIEAILAHWYWQYFQENRWRFSERTQVAAAPGPDLRTWDLARILTEIDRHFTAALANEAELKRTSVSAYDGLLEKGTAPDRYRPTLYDFLAYEALHFYQAGEQAAMAAEEEFEIDSAGPIFGDAGEFLHWQPQTTDVASPKLKAIRLYQSLLQFHQSDSDRSAFYDADLARLSYGKNVVTGEAREERYQAALSHFIESTVRHEISARAYAMFAQTFIENDPAKARALAQRGLNAFPSSAGGAECFNVIAQIEAPFAQLETEFVWNAPWPTLNLTYRNVAEVYFRAVPMNYTEYVTRSRRWGSVDKDLREEALAAKPALAWHASLPRTTDFKSHVERLPAPTSLAPGFYLILASHDHRFGDKNNQLSVAAVWVSDLALVMQMNRRDTHQAGLVLNARTGEPVPGATVRFWRSDRDQLQPDRSTTTDVYGRFVFSARDEALVVVAEHNGQAVSSNGALYSYGVGRRSSRDSRTVFFTDRAIYRPGQTINYKGVALRSDQDAAKYSAVAGIEVTVVFNDPNGREISRATHRTNDYGSFSGVFTAPRDRLPGQMSIQTDDPQGRTSISIEEYKRPKFQVELRAPVEAAKLDATVKITGVATAYTGASIGGAKVKWRVERSVRLPYWCWWWRAPASKAVAHGTAVTGADGTFTVEFPAVPDRTVPAKNEPRFVFTVNADVTDTTGETRSSERTVQAGYAALEATVKAEEWQTVDRPVTFHVGTTSLDQDPQPAKGTVTVYALKGPATVTRAPLSPRRLWWDLAADKPPVDPTNPDSWELGSVVVTLPFETGATGKTEVTTALAAGVYRAMLTTADRFGHSVTARWMVQVLDPKARRLGLKIPQVFAAPKWSVEVGETFTALWGTGYDTGRAYVEVECNGESLRQYWTSADSTQETVNLPVTETMRGGFTVRVTYVRENRAYTVERVVTVPWSDKELAIRWESFRSKLQPGAKETWTAVITGAKAQPAAAEMVATLYDASLDQYRRNGWPTTLGVLRAEWSGTSSVFQNASLRFQPEVHWPAPPSRDPHWSYRAFPSDIVMLSAGEDLILLSPFSVNSAADEGYRAAPSTLAGTRLRTELKDLGSAITVAAPQALGNFAAGNASQPPPYAPTLPADSEPVDPKLAGVTARRNLTETAFFFPHLISDAKGEVRITFTVPEALTQWKFLGFAHDRELRSGLLTGTAVTAKDLMVEPNPPRFVREGDAIEFTVKVSNQSDQPQTGTVRLTFADAASERSADAALGNRVTDQPFEIPPKQSRSYGWRIVVPDGQGFLSYKAVAAAVRFSDGEEGFLPVLSRRIPITESLPLQIRGPGTRQVEFKKLLDSAGSDTLRQQALTVQMASQPAWYAVMALPYLMEFPYECSEQVFDRFYANSLARHIANSDPKIRRVFELWKNTPAVDSPLEKNQDLKAVMLEETPWVRAAAAESQSRRNVGLLFDASRLDEESAATLRKLAERQLRDGLWSWFPGGPSSEYISLTIVAGFGRLQHMGVKIDSAPAAKALAALDAWMDERYRRIQQSPKPGEYVPTSIDALYLYARSFFLAEQPVAAERREAVDFLLERARKVWAKLECRQSQAQLALALQRFGDTETPRAILKSLKERSVTDPEMGMSWRDAETSWWWYHAPIETQAVMIEAFDEVAHDAAAVEDCKVWLLKQKQTQDWRTTKATADAVYALLLHGASPLASDALVEASLGGQPVRPEQVEAGTGFYEKKFAGAEITPSMGHVSLKKTDTGVSWGGIHWQYLEDIGRVVPHEGTPLKLKKALFVKETTARGPVLKPVTRPVAVGDELVVRLELRTDRDMEFVHLKDQRGSGVEPVDVLSRYRYQDNLGYYETTRDTATHFFIDYLPRGTYVFEYSTRVQLKGRYQTGIAEIQCMYAPEFNSHSESILLDVR